MVRQRLLWWAFLLPVALAAFASLARAEAGSDWPSFYGDDGRTHYSRLSQINTANVARLQPAWTFRASVVKPDSRRWLECNPIVVDGTLYGTTAAGSLFALDAATGRQKWRLVPGTLRTKADPPLGAQRVNRGVVYWADGEDRRILFTYGHYLIAANAATGQPVASFGRHGRVDFKEGMGRDLANLLLASTSPGALYHDLLILPLLCAEGPGPAAPGYICAYDVRSGRRVWMFHTIPHPGEYGYETWPPDAYKYAGGVNSWGGMAVDAERGLVFAPTGSPTYDFWGGNRRGENLFSDSLVCLDARTGKRVWHFQTTHHDVWDRDLPSAPTLLMVRREGRAVPAVAQITKSGLVWVFDRVTGKPLFPYTEVPAPSSDLAGESAWPTQPVPDKPAPFCRQMVTAADLTVRTPEAHRAALEGFARLKQMVPFQPPSLQATVMIPGRDGGAEWGGAAADPDGILYVNGSDMAWINPMIAASATGSAQDPGGNTYRIYCAVCHGLDRAGNKAQSIPELAGVAHRLARPDIQSRILQGKGVMPSFAFLPPKEREALIDYLMNVARAAPAAGEPSADVNSPIDPARATGYFNVPYVSGGEGRWLDKEGYPNVKPPWGTLNAIDLNTGDYIWRVPLGEYPELAAQGVPATGSDNYGGPVVTAGGLVFIAATRDELLRAFDRKSGKELWRAKLPAGGYATPSTYEAGGRQYVVIACGGGRFDLKPDDAYVAFALPP